MKKIFLSITILAFMFAGCSDNQTKEHDHNDGTHIHDDGSVHQNHDEDSTNKQEEFTAPVDTASQKADSIHEHNHDGQDGHKHPHKQ